MSDRLVRWSACLVVAAVSALVAWQQIGDWDVWWHLATGAWIDTYGVPREALFTWSAAGSPWRYLDAGAELLLWKAWGIGGAAGLHILRWALTAGAMAALALLPGAARHPVWVAAAACTILAVDQAQFLPRPLLVGTLCMVWTLVWLDRVQGGGSTGTADTSEPGPSDENAAIGASWAAAATVALWFQGHRGGVLGAVLLVGSLLWMVARFVAPGALRPWLGPCPGRRLLAHVAASTAVGVASGFATVNGPALYATAFGLNADAALRNAISEWQPLTWDIAWTAYRPALGVVGVALALALGAQARWRATAPALVIWYLGVVAVLGWQATTAVRHVGFAVIGCVVFALRVALASPWPPVVRPMLGLSAVAGFALWGTLALALHDLGMGPVPDRFPQQAMAEARRLGLGARVHNAFVYGGWVVWDGVQDDGGRVVTPESSFRFEALIDGRNETVYAPAFYLEATEAQTDPARFAELYARLPGDWVLADNTPGRETFGFLAQDPAWRMIFWSETAVIYVPTARIGGDAGRIAAQPYRIIHPMLVLESVSQALAVAAQRPDVLARAEAEVARMLETSPGSLRALSAALVLWAGQGPPRRAQADAVWQTLVQLHGDHPAVAALGTQLGYAPAP